MCGFVVVSIIIAVVYKLVFLLCLIGQLWIFMELLGLEHMTSQSQRYGYPGVNCESPEKTLHFFSCSLAQRL